MSNRNFASSLNSTDDPILKNYQYQVERESKRAGIPREVTIRHRFNGFSRDIQIAVPANSIGNPQTIVVFMADGQLVHLFAEHATESLRGYRYPPMAFFGLSSSDSGLKRSGRAEEYLGAVGEDLFDHHYDAFINVMPAFAERLLKIPLKRHTTVAAGFSNGGAFVYRMAIEHPELFANAILMSPARVRQAVDLSKLDGYQTKFFLAAGEEGLERLFKKNALRIKQDLDQAGIANTLWHDETTGHDIFLWYDAFSRGLNWLF